MKIITDWKQLEPGMHGQLSCKCAGVVTKVARDPSPEGRDTGYFITYTTWMCSDVQSCEKTVGDGYGPFSNFFNYGLAEESLSAIETPLPEWVEKNERFLKYVQDYQKRNDY